MHNFFKEFGRYFLMIMCVFALIAFIPLFVYLPFWLFAGINIQDGMNSLEIIVFILQSAICVAMIVVLMTYIENGVFFKN